MKNSPIILFILSALLLAACNGTAQENPAPTSIPKNKQIEEPVKVELKPVIKGKIAIPLPTKEEIKKGAKPGESPVNPPKVQMEKGCTVEKMGCLEYHDGRCVKVFLKDYDC